MALKNEERLKCLKTLGLGENATEDEIKRTYKKLALECHPDKNLDDPTATKKFQELSKCYYDLTSKYSKKSQCYCPDCGSLHTDFDDDDWFMYCDGYASDESEDEEYWMHMFKRLFMDVFSETIFQRRFQSKKKKKDYVYTDEEKREDSDFDFLFSQYCYDDWDDIQLTAEDLKKFHSYDDWLKARDPKKRHNHRMRKARKKVNLKMTKENIKPKNKKQQLAEQYRREKEMKEIAEKIEKEEQKKIFKSSKTQMKYQSPVKKDVDDFELIQQQEKSAQEQQKALQIILEKQEAQERKEEKKNKKKKKKQMKKQHETLLLRNQDLSTQNTVENQSSIFGGIITKSYKDQNSKAEVKQKAAKSELLQQHLDIFHSLMAVQPKRHTEQQLKEERSNQRELLIKKNQNELEQLRSEHVDNYHEQVKQTGGKSQQFENSTDFEKLRREHLQKQQKLERRRNNEEQEEILKISQHKTKHVPAKRALPVKWFEKPVETRERNIPAAWKAPAQTSTNNIWSERQRKMNEFDALRPQSPEEEENLLQKVLELSQKTAEEEEERRSRLTSIWSLNEDTKTNPKKPGKCSIQSGWKTEKERNFTNQSKEWTSKPYDTRYNKGPMLSGESGRGMKTGTLKPLYNNSMLNKMSGENWHEDVDSMHPNHGCPGIGPISPVIHDEIENQSDAVVKKQLQDENLISTVDAKTDAWIKVPKSKYQRNTKSGTKFQSRPNKNNKNERTSPMKKPSSQLNASCEIRGWETISNTPKDFLGQSELDFWSDVDNCKSVNCPDANGRYIGEISAEILSENPDKKLGNSVLPFENVDKCRDNEEVQNFKEASSEKVQTMSYKLQPRDTEKLLLGDRHDNVEEWCIENWGDEIESIINSELHCATDKNTPNSASESLANTNVTVASTPNFSQFSALSYQNSVEISKGPIISAVSDVEQKPYVTTVSARNLTRPLVKSLTQSDEPESFIETGNESEMKSRLEIPSSMQANASVLNSHNDIYGQTQSVNTFNTKVQSSSAGTEEDWESELMSEINSELRGFRLPEKPKDFTISVSDCTKMSGKNALPSIGKSGNSKPLHPLPRLPVQVLKEKNNETQNEPEKTVTDFIDYNKMASATGNDGELTAMPEKTSTSSVFGMPNLGMPPNLLQEYMQYLMKSSMGNMEQNMSDMLLLPPLAANFVPSMLPYGCSPMMLTSPVFAYSLMLQQQMQGRTQQSSQTEGGDIDQNSSKQQKFSQIPEPLQTQSCFSGKLSSAAENLDVKIIESKTEPTLLEASREIRTRTQESHELTPKPSVQNTATLEKEKPVPHIETHSRKTFPLNKEAQSDIFALSSFAKQQMSHQHLDCPQISNQTKAVQIDNHRSTNTSLVDGNGLDCRLAFKRSSVTPIQGEKPKQPLNCLPFSTKQDPNRNEKTSMQLNYPPFNTKQYPNRNEKTSTEEDWDQEIAGDNRQNVTVGGNPHFYKIREQQTNTHKQFKSTEPKECVLPSVSTVPNARERLQSPFGKYKCNLPPRLQRKREEIENLQSVINRMHHGE